MGRFVHALGAMSHGVVETQRQLQHLALVAMGVRPSGKVLGRTGFQDHTDIVVQMVLIVGLLVLTWLLQNIFFPLFAREVLGMRRQLQLRKFALCAKELLYYTFSLVAWGSLVLNEEWVWNMDKLWSGGRLTLVGQEIKTMYLLENSWYIVGLLFLLFADKRKKDFKQMLAHHLCTIVLISFSFYVGHLRIGIVVMLLHNVSDPFLHLAKIMNYIKIDSMSEILFVLFALTFVVARIVVYPQVVASSYFKGTWFFENRSMEPLEVILTWFLAALYPIHFYWLFLILKLAGKLMAGTLSEGDNRSDDEEEDEDEGLKPAGAQHDNELKED